MISARNLMFEGLFEKDVLGVFSVIRGFADLRDLAMVSVAQEMTLSFRGDQAAGHQRELNEQHAKRINQYLENSDNRFLPEIILSVRAEFRPEMYGVDQVGVVCDAPDGPIVRRRWKNKNMRVHQVIVPGEALDRIRDQQVIRRIDGNHRLALAEELVEDEVSPRKYLAPFCMILLGTTDNEADDYAESLMFHTINSTAVPLASEHGLALILGQNSDYSMTPDREFAYDPVLHLTRLLRDGMRNLPQPVRERFGDRPLTALNDAARSIMVAQPALEKDILALKDYADGLIAGLIEITPRVMNVQSKLLQKEYFTDLVARVWARYEGMEHGERVNVSVSFLSDLGAWLGHDGVINIESTGILSEQLLQIYDAVRARMPKRVFLARWLPGNDEGQHFTNANLRLEQIRRTLRDLEDDIGVALELVDIGTRTGGTFPIHREIYEEIASGDIILIDLTGMRPNVCVEAGYALKHHESGRLIFLFQHTDDAPRVPFDLSTFRYEPFSDTAEICGKLRPHLETILKNSGLNI